MKKLYLILLMLLILFIPTQVNAVAIYQLDQPVKELNNHTLREVFDDGNLIVNGNFNSMANWELLYSSVISAQQAVLFNEQYSGIRQYLSQDTSNYNDYYYLRYDILYNNLATSNALMVGSFGSNDILRITYLNENLGSHSYIIQGRNSGNMNSFVIYLGLYSSGQINLDNIYLYNTIELGISNLTKEQMDTYYNLYLEAVRFEQENIQASQDLGGYQNIFRSIINGVKNLISEMGYLWQWLNAPILTSDFRDYQFNIDWSWDLIGVIRQIINSAGVLVMQILFFVPSAMFILTGIPIQVSILSLLFSNLIFLLLGWIMVKSFLI